MQHLIPDNYKPAPTDSLRTQVCVVGSGAAGAVLAVRLAEKGVDVCVIEGGGQVPDFDLHTLAQNLDISGGISLRFGFSRQLGGATNLWAGRLAPFEAIDFKPRSWVSGGEWPFPYEDLLPYYDEAAVVLGIKNHGIFLEKRNDQDLFCAPDDEASGGGLETKRFFWAKTPFNAGVYIQGHQGRYPNLHVYEGMRIVSLEETEDTKRVKRAWYKKADGTTGIIEADDFVIAAGGLETPRLLLNSRHVRAQGIGNDHDVVGRYFSTHPKADMALLILNKKVPLNSPYFGDHMTSSGHGRYGLGFSGLYQTEHKLLNHYVQLFPLFAYRANRLFEALQGSRVMTSRFIDRSKVMRGLLPGLGLMAFEALGRLAGVQRKTDTFMLRAFLDQYPDPENRLVLSDQVDEEGMPKINIKWRFSDHDRQSVISFFKHMDEVLRARGIGRVECSKLETIDEWPIVGVHSHFMGTTRMGHDPRSSVTDTNACVHGMENLYVAGPSLFPSYGYANPVYTIAALSRRLAAHILVKRGLDC